MQQLSGCGVKMYLVGMFIPGGEGTKSVPRLVERMRDKQKAAVGKNLLPVPSLYTRYMRYVGYMMRVELESIRVTTVNVTINQKTLNLFGRAAQDVCLRSGRLLIAPQPPTQRTPAAAFYRITALLSRIQYGNRGYIL